MTLIELATRWNISTAALRLAISRGALRAEKVGTGAHGVWLVSVDEAARYQRENRGKHGASSPRHPKTGNRTPRKPRDGKSDDNESSS